MRRYRRLLRRGVGGRSRRMQSSFEKTAAWEALDAAETNERVRLSAIMKAIRTRYKANDEYRIENEKESFEPRSAEAEQYPPDESSCAILLRWLRSGGTLSFDFCLKVLQAATEMLKKEPRISYEKHQNVIVVGDIHGSAWDLCAAMGIAGTPSKKMKVIFNGDYVDRGPRSIEVLVTVLALKLCFKEYVHINRGNHEDTELSRAYDFEAELHTRFGANGASQVLAAASKCFAQMPIALVLNNDSLILHGNLPRDALSLHDFETTPRLETVAGLHFVAPSPNMHDARLLQDILWSDPNADQGIPFAPNAKRGGAGAAVSDDALANFLDKHNLKRLIRSHEVTALGAERQQLSATTERWTVFSQARYPYGEGLNKAAVLMISTDSTNKNTCLEAKRWSGVAPLTRYRGLGPRVRGLLRRHRDGLRAYASGDVYNDATAHAACAAAIGADHNAWRFHLLPAAFHTTDFPKSAAAIADAADNLRFELHAFDADATVQANHGNLSFTHRPSARRAFEALDKNNDGFISFDEFIAFVATELPALQTHQAAASWLFLDADDSGRLDLDEFQRGFSVLRDDRDPNNWDEDSAASLRQIRRVSSGFDYS